MWWLLNELLDYVLTQQTNNKVQLKQCVQLTLASVSAVVGFTKNLTTFREFFFFQVNVKEMLMQPNRNVIQRFPH